MNFNDYQRQSRKTALYPNLGKNLWYPTLGLAGETGEIAERVKKIYRDGGGQLTDEKKEVLKKELGDVLWYLAALATELGTTLDEIAWANLEKLFSRKDRGVLHGDGDNR